MKPTSPIYTANLFQPLHSELMLLLRGLSSADWERHTIARNWRVRDVVAHLLDVDLRKLAVNRDSHLPPQPESIDSYDDLITFLNGLNAEWVIAARRLSPRVLIELLEFTGPQISTLVSSLPPHEPARFPVAWAGESESENWFDIGRDYTERWHHQMQIRDAVGAPLVLLERRWMFPLLDLSFRALPVAYRDVEAPDGTAVTVIVGDDAWSIVREADAWKLYRGALDSAARVTIEADSVWRLLYNALPADAARQKISIDGNAALAEPLLTVRSVMV